MKFIAFNHDQQSHFMVFHIGTQHRSALNSLLTALPDAVITNAGSAKITKSGFAGFSNSFTLRIDSTFLTPESEQAFKTCKNGRLGWGMFSMSARFICDASLGEKLQALKSDSYFQCNGFLDPLLKNDRVEVEVDDILPFIPEKRNGYNVRREQEAADLCKIYNCEDY